MKIDSLKIRLLYSQRGITQAELAEEAGLSRAGLNILLRKGTCYPGSAYRIARALGVPPEEIIKSVK